MSFNIVLLEPEIPNNTGNIGRLCLATNSTLHLIKPLGFELSDSKLKRAGLDYWQYLNVVIYNSKEEFFKKHSAEEFVYFSSHSSQTYTNINFRRNQFLVFGKESVGLPKELINDNIDHCYKIPLHSEHIRSLNIANSVAIVIYEGLRQIKVS